MFMKAIAVALHHLPIGCMVSIRNAQPIPEDLIDKASGKLYHNVLDMYHGTSLAGLMNIVSEGFQASLGTGCDKLHATFGVPVPMV